MRLSNEEIVTEIVAQYGESVFEFEEPKQLLTFAAKADKIVELIQFLRDSDRLRFIFLTDITAVHFPDVKDRELCVVYHLHSFENGVRLRIKVYLPLNAPKIPTMTGLFAGANWMERETYDFYGINFEGHPNLKRILNIDEMDYFPMRKEYALEDATREDKIDALFGR